MPEIKDRVLKDPSKFGEARVDLMRYGNYIITYQRKPIPPGYDYDWRHEEYQGPGDIRQGSAGSIVECLGQIDEVEQELKDMREDNKGDEDV